ncbi:hypothetical protein BFG04_03945 [Campylobacter pinnipediorum subsp. pinnipediorum]|uniref:Uncharacterized protein n=1 Tax=Campylobacter pinnipediorum subsp. pinnipediorum TaxID=1660067 RepID=A0AAX0LB80_9BACT|nr:hypothetical protein [Campylobacter pinnipediorum]OPA77256.1 hypothetical protein BFG04_03945 [Campylobacter pinnipediorum subsp. pinnipediorum]
MINLEMVKADMLAIINQSASIDFLLKKDESIRKCHFNKYSKVIYDNGAVGTEITALITIQNNDDIKFKDIIEILGVEYEITKIIIESQVLKRLFLREL